MAPLHRHLPVVFCHFNWEWYMCEDQVAEKREGGVRLLKVGVKGHNQFISAWAAIPRGMPMPTTACTRPWNETTRDSMCACSPDDWHEGKMGWISEGCCCCGPQISLKSQKEIWAFKAKWLKISYFCHNSATATPHKPDNYYEAHLESNQVILRRVPSASPLPCPQDIRSSRRASDSSQLEVRLWISLLSGCKGESCQSKGHSGYVSGECKGL